MYYVQHDYRSVCIGLIIMVDETNNLTNWFLSSDTDPQSFDGVQISKNNESLVVAYRTGTELIASLSLLLFVITITKQLHKKSIYN